jgi:PEP-CTERM motif
MSHFPRLHRPALAAAVTAAALGLTPPAVQAAFVALPALATVPDGLVDPLSSLGGAGTGLAADQFLIPVVASADAAGLTTWSFDLAFDATVAAPWDAWGLFQHAYGSTLAGGATSEITASGILLPELLDDVSGFVMVPGDAVDGDVLAYVLFRYQPGQIGADPGVFVPGGPTPPVPEPGTGALACLALAALAVLHGRRGIRLSATTRRA